MKEIIIGNRTIGKNHPPFIIAEMSGNHNQSLERALQIVQAAAQAGAHAIKLQTYTADTMTLDVPDGDFFISDPTSLWYGNSLHKLYHIAHTPWEWHEPIFKRCKELGILGFSTPFDETAVDFLESLDVPCYKIASFENVDLSLIRKVAATGKPVIISTGLASVAEIDEAVKAARGAGCKDLILLKCTSAYPASAADANLATIPHMQQLFDCLVGCSDHTLGIGASIASVVLGARVIEKHLTLSCAQGGVDAAFSLEPSDLKNLVEESERAWAAVGNVRYGFTQHEAASLQYRRSLYLARDVVAGAVLTQDDIKRVRPGFGLAPKYEDLVVGKTMKYDAKKGARMSLDMVL